MKLYVINTGTLHGTDGSAPMPVMCFLIENDGEYILFDTGCHDEAALGYWPAHYKETFALEINEEEHLVNRLALIGLRPEDIHKVVLSHLHLDHMGGIRHFSYADVWAPKADFIEAETVVHAASDPKKHGGYIRAELEVPVKQYHLVEEDGPLIPGVEMINLPGHTPGLLGLVVHLTCGAFILTQDALDDEGKYLPETVCSGREYDTEAYKASVEKIRALQKKYDAAVFYGHDYAFYQGIRQIPEYFE